MEMFRVSLRPPGHRVESISLSAQTAIQALDEAIKVFRLLGVFDGVQIEPGKWSVNVEVERTPATIEDAAHE